MRTTSGTRAAAEWHGIDLAPMLDFVVNLLIFFIVTAVFVKQAGVTVSRPAARSGIEKPSKAIVIDEHGEISVDAKTIDLRALRAHIEQFRATTADGGIWDITFTTTQ